MEVIVTHAHLIELRTHTHTVLVLYLPRSVVDAVGVAELGSF